MRLGGCLGDRTQIDGFVSNDCIKRSLLGTSPRGGRRPGRSSTEGFLEWTLLQALTQIETLSYCEWQTLLHLGWKSG